MKIVKPDVLSNSEPVDPVDSTVDPFDFSVSPLTLNYSNKREHHHIYGLANRLNSAKKSRLLTDVETARLAYFSYFHCIMSNEILL